ncbi:MAG: hypothetical protein AVO34_14055 [Firmicutes bacterium ML8_F2]|jgi:murein peptide amidase A|nr:MAG: hypothetical protein AVO34_14055 [Firmicutes bacterium ML8_F2]
MKKCLLIATIFLYAFYAVSCASGGREPFTDRQPEVRVLETLETRLHDAVSISEKLEMTAIGEVHYADYRAPIWVVSYHPGPDPDYHLLLCGGIHGNEPAGVEIMIHFIEMLADNEEKYHNYSIDIIPLINPWGWSHDLRFNQQGIDVNRDFASFESQEAILVSEFTTKKRYDLIIDCHEDPDASGFYIYQYANRNQQLSRNIIEVIRKLDYPIEQDVNMIILKTDDGLIDAPLWGLYYMKMTGQLSMTNYFRLNHSDLVYTIETPTELPWESRITMQQKAAEMLIESLQ